MEKFKHSKAKVAAEKSVRRKAQWERVLLYTAMGVLGAVAGYVLWGFPQAILAAAALMYLMYLVSTPTNG